MADHITTAEALDALSAGEAVIDRHGDVWSRRADGLWESPETAPFKGQHVVRKWGPLRVLNRRPTPDPIAPDARREAVAAILAVAYSDDPDLAFVSAHDESTADAVLAEVAKHRDAEVERLRDQRNQATWALSEAPGFIALHHDLTNAQDRITRALAFLEGNPARLAAHVRAILTAPDQEADRG